jgi:predicted dehydrogenase
MSSRRRFLKTTVATAAAPFILPSRVWSAPVNPSDRISVAFIGTGKQAGGLIGGFLGNKEVQCVAVCDVDTTRREAAKQRIEEHYSKQTGSAYKGCESYVEYEKIMARDDIDAVVIATPDHWHAPISLAVLKAGKDVYCEKPLTHTIHEAVTLINAVKTTKRILQTGSQQRSSREFRIACELVQNGVIGKVMRVDAGFGAPPRPCDLPEEEMEAGLDWSRWLGPAPMRPYNQILSPRGLHNHFPKWRDYDEFSNGYVGDWGAHHLDIAQWGLGHDGSGPVEIVPPAGQQRPNNGGILKYADGTEVTHTGGNGVTFFGDKGKILVNRGQFELWWGETKEDREFISVNQVLKAEEKYLTEGTKRLYNSKGHTPDFIESIRTRKPPICNVEVGAGTAICCHLLNIAYRSGQTVKWDPAKRELISGDKSLIWYRKERRAPFDKFA